MGSRLLNNESLSCEREVVTLFARLTVHASDGTVAVTRGVGKGIASVAHTTTGVYTVTLEDQWARLLEVRATVLKAGAATHIITPHTETNVSTSTKTLVLAATDLDTPALTDLAANDIVLLAIVVGNTAN